MNEFTMELLKFVVMFVMAILVYVIRRNLVPFIQSKMTEDQLKTAQEMAKMFVYMAEQAFGDKSGQERKQIVKDALQEALKNAGINMTDQFIDDMIEAAVKGMKIAESGGVLELEAVEGETMEAAGTMTEGGV
jgi:LL-H family phage holin|nr:MAG TPA: holin [Caudoviricetes sp.]